MTNKEAITKFRKQLDEQETGIQFSPSFVVDGDKLGQMSDPELEVSSEDIMTLAQQYLQKIQSEGEYGEFEARESEDCLGAIWPHGDSECNGYWLDVFVDGSAIECSDGWGESALTAAETKRVAGRWADYKEIKNQIKGRPHENRSPNRIR